MKLGTTNFFIKVSHNGTVCYAKNDDKWSTAKTLKENCLLKNAYRMFKFKLYDEQTRVEKLNDILSELSIDYSMPLDTPIIDAAKVESMMTKMIDFFSEFSFEPNYRFMNTFAYACNESRAAARNYIKSYFELIDNQFLNSIVEKIKSYEFETIIDDFASIVPTHKVNNRFRLYYGSAGTGKTKTAMKEAEGNCMVCHSAMLPSDLMEDFKFIDGKATFSPSALQIAMTEGKTICLDEINLLPFESLRFLQTILDGKEKFMYKGNEINIAEGFKIIGTMNLIVNGSTFALPDPLVDRAEKLEKYKLTAKDLVHAIV